MSQLPSHHIFPSPEAASEALASEIGNLVSARATADRPAVLGLATGSTPIRLYAELVRLHRQGLSFSNVITFNLDEYLGIGRDHPESYWQFMHSHLFEHIDIAAENIHIPDGSIAEEDLDDYCAAYEQKISEAGGIDLQVLGIGRNGHIGFNEPGTSADLPTHVTELNPITIADAADSFGGVGDVPRRAITMGVKTILNARRVTLLAFGKAKAEIVGRALTPGVTPEVPATYLQLHGDSAYFLDQQAGASMDSQG